MKLKKIMQTDVIVAEKGTSVIGAVNLMIDWSVNNIIVLEGGKAAGIITETDILKKVVAPGKDPKLLKVEDIMAKPLITGTPNMSIEKACGIMTKNHIKKLPITEKGRLVGIVTATDIIANEPANLAKLANLILKPTEVVGG